MDEFWLVTNSTGHQVTGKVGQPLDRWRRWVGPLWLEIVPTLPSGREECQKYEWLQTSLLPARLRLMPRSAVQWVIARGFDLVRTSPMADSYPLASDYMYAVRVEPLLTFISTT